MGALDVALATKLKSMVSADLITEILIADMVALPKEFTGAYYTAVANPFACRLEDEEVVSCQGSVS